ncbi:hypothetical protein GYMLUDRAFT_435382 [Collybiopsis luxurians FD-317 M1]|uniref:Uncharacterized protein n=1 Tax=Collybiopsis luxurians FD-317 M1 TaxID=944289 RepID=A0A0D0CM78_9AGAR|nr:hypothetical protein GYMLUDRAFT_435382 [Collybiopsis luxurians FD-317 M1]
MVQASCHPTRLALIVNINSLCMFSTSISFIYTNHGTPKATQELLRLREMLKARTPSEGKNRLGATSDDHLIIPTSNLFPPGPHTSINR